MATKIIDTNVPLTASQALPHQQECQQRCIQFLRQLLNEEIKFVADEDGLFYKEYRHHLYPDPNPSAAIGSQFLSYFITNQYDNMLCSRVSLTQVNNEFVDFPVDPDLSRFDRSDRKWVAAAKQLLMKNQEVAPIVNAVDSAWAHFEAALNNHGVAIDFLCDKTHLKKD